MGKKKKPRAKTGQAKKQVVMKPMPRLDREEIMRRVMEKYGYSRWEVEFAADHLLGVRLSPEQIKERENAKFEW